MTHSSDSEMARLQADIPEELKTQAKIEALKAGITLSELVEQALRAHLAKMQKQK